MLFSFLNCQLANIFGASHSLFRRLLIVIYTRPFINKRGKSVFRFRDTLFEKTRRVCNMRTFSESFLLLVIY